MRKTLTTIALIAALVAGVGGVAASATATPGKTKSCSNCHDASSAVKITLTKKSSTSTKVTYKIKVTGGSGAAGWAVLKGSTNVKHATSSTGTFTVRKGRTYKVWAVKKGTGSVSKTISPK